MAVGRRPRRGRKQWEDDGLLMTRDSCPPGSSLNKQKTRSTERSLSLSLNFCAPDVVELLVDAHELLDRVDVDARVLGVHALHALLAGDDAVALGDTNDVDEVAEDRVEHDLLVALVREEVRSNLVVAHGDLQTLTEREPHVLHEFVEVHAVRVVGDVAHDLLEDCVIAPRVRAEGTGVSDKCVWHTLVAHVQNVLNKRRGLMRLHSRFYFYLMCLIC
jgi:hypothetical protein